MSEKSVPVQSRVDLVSLAGMVHFWEKSGYSINTMSQLVSWSVDLVYSIVKDNGMSIDMEVGEAVRLLEDRGLFQKSMKKRSMRKMSSAIRFEGLRKEGLEPASVDPVNYRLNQSDKGHQPFEGLPEKNTNIDVVEEAIRRGKEEERKEIELLKLKNVETLRSSNSFVELARDRDKRVEDAENKEPDLNKVSDLLVDE